MDAKAAPPLYDLVVVGSSAGGIEALTRLVSAIPAGFPAPIVLAQHLDPDHPSRLADILARRTALTVRQLEDGPAQPLTPGAVYVPPAARDVEIVADTVRVRAVAERRPRPSIDLLLSSAARAYGERTLAVILTGTGSDGADGAREVSAAGGMVIIENPRTARYPMLPASLAPSTVDLAVDLDRIGPLVFELLTGTYAVSPSEPRRDDDGDPLETILQIVQSATGVDFSRHKPGTIQRRVQRRMAAIGVLTVEDYSRYVAFHPDECDRLAASFLINVTEFFRDRSFFDYLRDSVLPDLVAYGRTHGNRLRIWSSGCSTGEEPYSLAMLIADYLGSELPRFTVHIFATDADPDAIAFARAGVYPVTALTAVPERLRTRYFTQVDGGFVIDRRIRGLVVFGEHDLGKRAPFPEIDLVLCRNVLIYFTAELQRRALQLFAFALRDEGYLTLGTSESIAALPDYFASVNRRLRIFKRYGGRVLVSSLRLAPPGGRRAEAAFTGQRVALLKLAAEQSSTRPTQSEGDTTTHADGEGASEQLAPSRPRTGLERLGEQMLGLSAGVVVVDGQYDVLAINTAAYDLLDVVGAAHGNDLLHLADRVPTKPLRAAIDAAFQSAPLEQRQITLSYEVSDGATRHVQITCIPRRSQGEGSGDVETPAVDVVVMFVSEVTPEFAAISGQQSMAASVSNGPATGRRWRRRLAAVSEESPLRPALDEAQAANRDLRAALKSLRKAYDQQLLVNEEMAVRQEEAQSTSEQARTLNEELQATNEELETLNEEMEANLEQLSTTNEDLQSRAQELEALNMEREALRQDSKRERVRLATILASLSDALLVMDAGGNPLLTNAAYDQLFGPAAQPAMLQDLDGRPLPENALPARWMRENAPFTMEFCLVGPGGRRVLEARGEPVVGQGEFLGGVVTIRDVDDRRGSIMTSSAESVDESESK